MKINSTILENCLCLGSSGHPITAGTSCLVALSSNTIKIRTTHAASFEISISEVSEIHITGPGTVTTGGGFTGGGFGVEGAIEGIAVATILNALTKKTKIHTFLTFITNAGELHFHYPGMEPSALRIALAQVFAALRRLNPDWQRMRLSTLQLALEQKIISEDDFLRLKERLSHPPEQCNNADTLNTQTIIKNDTLMGYCPSCKSKIPLNSEECTECKAMFGEYSTWRIIPI